MTPRLLPPPIKQNKREERKEMERKKGKEEIKGRTIEEEVKKRRGISVAIFPPTSCGCGVEAKGLCLPRPR